jgi:hypothetical protein
VYGAWINIGQDFGVKVRITHEPLCDILPVTLELRDFLELAVSSTYTRLEETIDDSGSSSDESLGVLSKKLWLRTLETASILG